MRNNTANSTIFDLMIDKLNIGVEKLGRELKAKTEQEIRLLNADAKKFQKSINEDVQRFSQSLSQGSLAKVGLFQSRQTENISMSSDDTAAIKNS